MLSVLAPLAANERPLINIDATLFINIGLWIVLFVILRGLLWSPVLRLINARENGLQGSKTKAERLRKRTTTLKDDLDLAQKKARATAAEARDKLRDDARKKESEILADARKTSHQSLEKQRAEIDSQRAQLRTEVMATVPQFAADISAKVLGREVRS